MEFKRFVDFLKEKGILEMNANKEAMSFDTKIAAFRNRFQGMPHDKQLEILKTAGYNSIPDFLHDGDMKKWTKLRIPGQENYVN